MTTLIDTLKLIYEQYMPILGAITSILSGLIVIFTFIPGDQPEKALQAVIDLIKKVSKKPKED